jgi:spore coat polysaccharide biosynthesis protein SpsF (cytidylyltransferase family)
MNLAFYRGSVNDVLDRFYQAAKPYHPEWVVRLTSDCPLMDAALIDEIVSKAIELDVDYCSNTLDPTYPDGIDIELMKFSALEKAWKEATSNSDREHVTPYIHQNSTFFHKTLFRSYNYSNEKNYGGVRLTVDEPKDFEVIRTLIDKLGTDKDWKTYADRYMADEEIARLNQHIQRNEGYLKS